MTNPEERRYSDEEFALILSRAADAAETSVGGMRRSAGFSLDEMKPIAAEAGIDPLLVERAARITPVSSGESRLVRVLGGPVEYQFDAVIDAKMTQRRAQQTLRSVQAAAAHPGNGDADPSGMSWNSVGFTRVFVTAHSEGQRSRVFIRIDRRPAAIVTGALGLSGTIIGLAIIENSMPIGAATAYSILATSAGGTLALARISWAAASRRFRARAAALLDVVSCSMEDSGSESAASEARRSPARGDE